jgi:Lon protease-like protein
VDQELQSARQYRIVKADYADYESDIHADDSGDTIDRERLAQCVRQYFARQQMENLWPSVEEFPGDLLVNSLSMVCPFPSAEKQALLEAATVADRAAMLIALIEMSMADNQGPEGMLQ